MGRSPGVVLVPGVGASFTRRGGVGLETRRGGFVILQMGEKRGRREREIEKRS